MYCDETPARDGMLHEVDHRAPKKTRPTKKDASESEEELPTPKSSKRKQF